MKKSIRSKLVFANSALIAVAIAIMTIVVVVLVEKQIQKQTYTLLQSKAHILQNNLEKRISYLVENTKLLTTNELMINAFTDYDGRKNYLPKLVTNFMRGKDVVSLNVVDFDGKAIFQTQKNIPHYNESSQLRIALAVGETSIYLQKEDKELVVVSPIKYYETTQGAVVVVFDIAAIAKRNLATQQDGFIRLLDKTDVLFEYNFDKNQSYKIYIHKPESQDMPFFKQLGIILEVGIPYSIYNAPIKEAILILVLIGIIFIGISVFVATIIAKNITRPILKLHKRVKASNDDNNILCSPLGTNDELEDLAIAFDERTLKLQYQAQHDALTKLPNRILFIDRLKQAIKIRDEKGDHLAVLFIDIDRFKEVNDSFGHTFGDMLLKVVSDKMESNISLSNSIARLGGDEFLILIDHFKDEKTLIDVIQKITSVFKEPITIEHHQFYITISMGIAIYPLHGKDADALIKNADAAMYRAKNEGRNTYKFYTDDLTTKALQRITLETQLREAVKNDEFEVYLQPQIDMRDSKIIGMESLVRWNHPKFGLVPPSEFIPLAEETGIIIDIDKWIMKNAMKQFSTWIKDGYNPGVLSLNLSMIQLNHEDFISFVKESIKASDINVSSLMFEITETQIMRNPEHSIIVLNQLKSLGVRLAIDDFGTGHSSLSYLKRLPVDKIKIDQSFVRDIPADKDDMELTKAIIALSSSLKLELIAEGVETKEQAEFLVENGCYEAQGYLYYKSMKVVDVDKILKNVKA
ncbi:MAG: EAL domain-containing protein [Campylobacterales bacterium]|nr:EAL domain-containing protein [Campylobacterales bacterium]